MAEDSEPLVWLSGQPYTVVLFYRYVKVAKPQELCNALRKCCIRLGLLGRILVAEEGINGTLAGLPLSVDSFIQEMKADDRFSKVDWKSTTVASGATKLPFLNLSIREVTEIVSSGRQRDFISSQTQFDGDTFGGITGTGTHLTPEAFHHNLHSSKDNERILLDVRNQFEYDIGHFKSAQSLNCATYAETWTNMDSILKNETPEKPIYMYCTGKSYEL
jgi:UPF0176 protein